MRTIVDSELTLLQGCSWCRSGRLHSHTLELLLERSHFAAKRRSLLWVWTLSTITNQVQRSTTNKLQHESTQQRVQNCACVLERCHWFLRFTFACWPLLHRQVCVEGNQIFLIHDVLVSLPLGLQVPRIVRVVWAWLEGCAVAGGHLIPSPIRGRPLMPVLWSPRGASPAGF